MTTQFIILLHKLRFFFFGILILVSLFVVSIPLSSIEVSKVQAKEADSSTDTRAAYVSDSPNAVTSGMAEAMYKLGEATDSAEYTLLSGTQSAASTVAQGGRSIARGMQTGATAMVRGVGSGFVLAGRTVGKGAGAVGRTIGKGAGFVFGIPGNVLGAVSNTSVVNDFIRPSDHVEVPIIDPNSPELHAALTALPAEPAKDQKSSKSNPGPQWPIHGQVTTEFGVSHWPFQHTHSGIDISDARAPGITPIKPFRPGRVVDTVHSGYGLGNHVIVDHGSGVTSVYAHLASISVQTGQQVALGTVLGLEGSTGASTGTHLHFEIRVHGQAADPRRFISGHP
jgi:murein DD-endopeptidase MepM/ murein hydrolase activator NlpD